MVRQPKVIAPPPPSSPDVNRYMQPTFLAR